MSSDKKNQQKYIVAQSNKLIEADYSKSKLPARSLKVGRLIISKINPNDVDFRLIRVKNSAIREYLGYKKNVPYNRFSADLEDICKRLNDEPIKIQTQKGSLLNAFLISSWETDFVKDETVFEISGRLKEYLLALQKNYTAYQLENIPKLNSSYSIRMYELLYQYKKIAKRKFEVENLKKMIGCNYPLYGHFKSKAILKAQRDLVKFTDIKFEFEEIKKGRKVVELLFYIYPNVPKSESKQGVLAFLDDAIELEDKPKLSNNILESLATLGISHENIEKLLKQGFNIIQEKDSRANAIKRCREIEVYYLEKITLYDQSKTRNSNPAGFIIKALKEDWRSPKVFQEQKKREGIDKRKEAEKKLKIMESELEKLSKEKKNIIQAIYSQLLSNETTAKEAYDNSLEKGGSFYKNNYRDLLSKPIIQQYSQNKFLEAGMNAELYKTFPDKFKESDVIESSINDMKIKIEGFKKEFNL